MPEVEIRLHKPHPGQQQIRDEAARYNAVACGRQWGKTDDGTEHVIQTALDGFPAGWFAPAYKYLEEAWERIAETLSPFGSLLQTNKQDRVIRLPGGGRIDFWTLNKPDAGRGRKYKLIVIDEAALVPNLKLAWHRAIRATLLFYKGSAWFYSTPRGMDDFQDLWMLGQDEDHPEWMSWQMPSHANPHLDPAEVQKMRDELPADAEAQEVDAEFLANAANPFGLEHINECLRDDLAEGPVVAWGVDLAKSHDWTVATGLNAAGDVCVWQRWQGDWRNTRSRLIAMLANAPAEVDATGVGDPIVEDLQAHCPLVSPFKFTSQTKQMLMEGLAVAIQTRSVRFPDGRIRKELCDFRYEYTAAGVRYRTPEGKHDDCVDSLALAWRALSVQNRTRVRVRVVGGVEDTTDRVWFGGGVDPDDEERFWR